MAKLAVILGSFSYSICAKNLALYLPLTIYLKREKDKSYASMFLAFHQFQSQSCELTLLFFASNFL